MKNEASLSFFNSVSVYRNATEQSLIELRKIYPEEYILLACDGCDSYMEMAKTYNCEYLHCNKRLGYQQQPHGYKIEDALDFLSRFYIAAVRSPSSHIMLMEDDIILTRPLKFDYDCEHMSVQSHEFIPEPVLDWIYQFSGKYPKTNYYAGCGGSIYKVSTFIEYYPEVVKFMRTTGRIIQDHIYPTIGWVDCFMTIFFMLAGKDFTVNPRCTELPRSSHDKPKSDIDYDKLVNDLRPDYDVIMHYKKYY